MLGTKFIQDLRTTSGIVADKLNAGFLFNRPNELIREFFEHGEWLIQDRARQFPMTGGGIFAGRLFLHFAMAGVVAGGGDPGGFRMAGVIAPGYNLPQT